MKKHKWKLGIVLVMAASMSVAAWTLWLRGDGQEAEIFTAEVARGTIQNAIISTGKVDAMVTVEVGSQVTGQVQALYANFNSIVRQGQILAQLDPRNVETQLRNAQANLSSARSRIETTRADRINADASLASAEANLVSARMELVQAETNLKRADALHADNLVPDTEVENLTIQLQSARARLTQQEAAMQQAEAQIISRDAAILQAEAALEQAEANLEESELNVEYTTIRSPVDGVVISREVDVGQTVSASTSAPTLYVIANDLSRMQVEASIDEADIGLLGQDNRVDFAVDAYPDDTFVGRIDQIRLNPTTTQNVVTYGVIITVENPELKLKPGMTANITITVDRRDDVLTVPNAALRYEPPDTLIVNRAGTDVPGNAASGDRESGSQPPESGFVPAGFQAAPGPSVADQPAALVAPRTTLPSMPGQLWDNGAMIQFQAVPPAEPHAGRVWVMSASGVPQMRDLMVGITDGSRTEVVSGNIREGEQVVISDSWEREEELNRAQENANQDNRQMFRMMRGGAN